MSHKLLFVFGGLAITGCSAAPEEPYAKDQEIIIYDQIPAYVSSIPARCDGKVTTQDQRLVQAAPVHFDFDSAQIRPDAKAVLDCVAATEQIQPVNLHLQGHTDQIGSARYNQQLGWRRAEAAADYLQSQGVERTRLTEGSSGKSQPIAPNKNAEGRALNRRVEIYAE